MKFRNLLASALATILLTGPALADKKWVLKPDGIVLYTAESFEKNTKNDVKNSSLNLFDRSKNVQLIVSQSGFFPEKGEKKPPKVTVDEMIKAFPVLVSTRKLEVVGKPDRLKVGGKDAVIYEIQDPGDEMYQTVYAYVDRGATPYTVILNYGAPRDPGKVKLMRQILGSVRHI